MKAIIYDIEIKKAIQSRNEEHIEGVEYCKGWKDYEGMGISVIAAYDYAEGRSRVFCKDNIGEFQTLVDRSDMIIGFNHIGFDNQVCLANGISIEPWPEKNYDLLAEIWNAAGLSRTFGGKSYTGYSLDACIKANFPEYGKTGHGALAPVHWQQGRIGNVIDYCLADVWLTKMLFEKIANENEINDPKEGGILKFENPEWAHA